MLDFITNRLHYRYFLREKQKVFLDDLAMLIADGVPLNQAVETICKVSNGIIERVARHIMYCLAQGKQLADGMLGWFPRLLVEVIRSGEENENLLKTLSAIKESISEQIEMVKSFLGLIAYPALILVATFLMMIFVRHYVFDSFSEVRPIAKWPDLGQSLYCIGFLVEHWWWLAIIIAIFTITVISQLLQQLTGNIRMSIDGWPIISLYRDITAARFMEALGLLISNGIALKKALSIMHRDASPYLSWHILQMEFTLSGGDKDITNVLNTKLISHQDIIRLRAITKNKALEHVLVSLGRQARLRTFESIVMMGKWLSGLLLLLAILIAVSLAFGIYSVGSVIVT